MAQLIADLPQTPASVSTVDSVFVGEGMQRADVNNAFRALAAMVKSDFARSANTLTAASVFTLASISTGDYVRMAPYAGQSITSFGPATDGLQKFLESTGTQLLRNGASLSVQGGADLTLAAGDVVWARRDQSVWKSRIFKADGTSVVPTIPATISASTVIAQNASISAIGLQTASISSGTFVSLSASVGNFSLLKVGGHGTVVQSVQDTDATYTTCSTDLPCDNSIPQITEGDEVLSIAITPVNASSTLYIRAIVHVGATTAGEVGAALFVDATAAALNGANMRVNSAAGMGGVLVIDHAVSAGSTSARTYRVRLGPDVGGPASAFMNGDNTSRKFGGILTSSLTVTEVLP